MGSIASYTVTAQDVETYQWYYSKDGGVKWYKSTASGADTDTVSFKATSGNRGNLYRCRLTSAAGKTVYTEPAGFAPGLAITKQPESVSASIGERISFSFSAENAASYQWYYSKDGGVKWYKSSASGCTSDTITLTVSKTNSVNQYRCRVTGTDGTMQYTEMAGITLI